ncbi:cysteine-rich repeat secretory protein 38-like [Vigna umbellata]|uniref:cysteine-rich repeat secretory protein 38-like n=1 Tax=Vigna umbellata TaxID=87088 RepID=UPI001F5E926E|nr:cysteine-rich repeat secretory protein 38-like [Vigna umbellata]
MYSSKLYTTLVLVSLSLFFHQTSFGDPLFYFCSKSGNFTANSPYETQLKTLVIKLIYKTYSTGFAMSSVGYNVNSKPYGLALCRGDVSSSECKTCVDDATEAILSRCPYNKGGIIWYDNCMFKYSDTEFFGTIDNTNIFYMWNRNRVTDPTTFNLKTIEFLSEISKKAWVNNPKLYASGEQKLENSDTLYGMAQCTRDLSSYDCKKCLADAINDFPHCCAGQKGARLVGGSCNFRYELYPFLKQ